MTPEQAVARTRTWLERRVIGLGLCPFARGPYEAGRVAMPVCRSCDVPGLYREVLALVGDFLEADPDRQETSLVLVTGGLEDFLDYLDLLAELDAALDEAGLRGIVQIASFHPDYRFAGAPPGDPANYTNRSPVPIFHLIREDLLAAALDNHPEPQAIPVRNVQRLRSLDPETLRDWTT